MPTSKNLKPSHRKPKSKQAGQPKQRPAEPVADPRPRRLRLPPYKLFRTKRVEHPVKLPSIWQLTKQTSLLLWHYRWLFLWLGVIYALLNIIFVRGLSGSADVGSLKNQIQQGAKGNPGQLAAGSAAFTGLLASSGNANSTAAGVYQIVLVLVVSLAIIWALRQASAGEKMRWRDPFYKGMYPLVPFVLVALVVLLQTVPFMIGAGAYNLAITDGIAVGGFEKLLWALLFAVLTLISVYMLCSSLFALYIVTLPDMTPLKALRSARKLVNYRRLAVFRKLLFLPVALLVFASVVMAPFVFIAPAAATWAFFIVGMAALILSHAYMYTLYRELLA